ncbi:hypothetical protein BC343_13540 [Mucilaginibacter pedocola]|uniref:Uncharacterized protein n=1 Tax=Mucilaginibacter pedocola TaxID=1792845 RepID=A0A1S9PA44_9SPHI|nr:hypothetical protein [Mucilaginibacter pedocola]OOQ57801.1 hypothetical protein BC343_13540 [Mucilaginibacter pedocola]
MLKTGAEDCRQIKLLKDDARRQRHALYLGRREPIRPSESIGKMGQVFKSKFIIDFGRTLTFFLDEVVCLPQPPPDKPAAG